MATLLQNAWSLLCNPRLFREYLNYQGAKVLGRTPTVATPFKGRVSATTFSQFHSVYCLMPSEAEVNLVRRLGPDNGNFFDVGANVGVWSVMLAKSHPGSRVFSFEPSPSVFRILQGNVELNALQNVTCEQLAVCNAQGTVQFQEPRNASVFSRILLPSANDHGGRFASSEICTVRCIRLDEYCREHSIQEIHFLKVDVEGAEPLVLQGLAGMLRNQLVRVMYIETEVDNLRSFGLGIIELFQAAKNTGYGFFRLLPDGRPGARVELQQIRGGNLLCMPA